MSQPEHPRSRPLRPVLPVLPLGALAAGFGLAGVAAAQTPAAATPPAAAASAPAAGADAGTVMPVIKAKAAAVRQGKDSLQAVTTSIGKGTQELRDIPQSVTVVTERLIDDRNLDTLKEALHNTAGISFQAAEGGEEDIRLRGFSLQSTGDIYIDGIRDTGFYERDTFNDDRIEVLRGSASMLFGRGSTGGVVNQVNKLPLLFGRNEVAATLGSGNYVRGTADLNFRLGEESALRVNAMNTQSKGYGAGIDKEGLAMSYSVGIGTASETTLAAYHMSYHNPGVNYGMPWLSGAGANGTAGLVPVDPKNYYGAASDYSGGQADYATLTHVRRGADGEEWKTVFRLGRYERDLRASAIRFASASAQPDGKTVTASTLTDKTVLTRGNNNKIQDLDSATLTSDYSKRFAALGVKHTLLAGLDLTAQDFSNYNASSLTKPNTTLGTPNDGGSVDETKRTLTWSRGFTSTALGLFAQDLVQLSSAWKIVGGLRWDRFAGQYDTPQTTSGNGTVTAAAHRERTDSLWSKRVGVLFQPTAFQSYHFSYGTSFNTSGDAYQYDDLSKNTPPEGSVNYELGGKLEFYDGNLSVRAALFHSVKTNERVTDTESASATNYLLSGKRHAAGLELDIAGRITPAWEVFASYAFIPDAEIDQAAPNGTTLLSGETVGMRPGLTPRHSGTIWTTYKLTPQWRVGGGLNARGADRPMQSTNIAPRYVTGDLMAEYSLNDDMSFKFNLTNVTNKLYADMLYRGHYIPGKARTFQMTGSYRF